MATSHESPENELPESSPASPESADAPKARPKAKVSPARNAISIVLLVVLLVVGALELTALFRFNGAVARLDEALEANEQDLLPKDQVEAILGKAADGPLRQEAPNMQVTTYTWRGAIRSHVLTGYYSAGTDPGMIKYEIGAAEAPDPGGD